MGLGQRFSGNDKLVVIDDRGVTLRLVFYSLIALSRLGSYIVIWIEAVRALGFHSSIYCLIS